MVILEILVSILYIVLIILFVLIVLALAIGLGVPAGLLYGVYWLLFRSWRKDKRKKNKPSKNSSISGKEIRNIVNKAIHAKNNDEDFDKEEFKKEINELTRKTVDKEDIH